jgi:hypothetical protein
MPNPFLTIDSQAGAARKRKKTSKEGVAVDYRNELT